MSHPAGAGCLPAPGGRFIMPFPRVRRGRLRRKPSRFNDMAVNYYDLLGVARTATDPEIRNRFRLLARERHPDRFQGEEKARAEKDFQVLTEAVNVLTNPQRRKAHDFELEKGGRAAAVDPKEVAKAYVNMGIKAFKSGDFTAAIANFDMAAKHSPNDAKAFQYLGMACMKSGNPRLLRQGIASIERAIELEPMNPAFLRDAAQMYQKAGLGAKAERAWESILKWMPDDAEASAALAEIRGGRQPEAGKGLLGGLFRKSDG